MSSFCGYPEMVLAFNFLCLMPVIFLVVFAVIWSLWLLVFIPVVLFLYLWFFEGVPWRGRYYGYCMEPGGGLDYSGEEEDCRCCKHIQDQLDCKYGSAVDEEKRRHKEDWRRRYPCSQCHRSGAETKQDLYRGPVRWSEGERP